jgi:Uncharacterized protein conserved in bacteria
MGISDLAHRKTAVFSPDRTYRYVLVRAWAEPDNFCMFIGLNPSTATETEDDPTVRRCIAFAHRWGFGGMYMTNIFSIRATDPKVMLAHESPVGPENDQYLVETALISQRVVACWGAHGRHRGRGAEVAELMRRHRLYHLGLTKQGHPKHPLYLANATEPQLWVRSVT